MKKISFQRKPSVIRGIKERPRPKRINWDRWIYLFILFIIVTSILVYIFNKQFYVTANGQVLSEKFDVNFPYDIQILKIFVNEGDSVKEGQPLFTHRKDFRGDGDGGGNSISVGLSTGGNDDWYIRERLHVLRDISLKQIERQAIVRNLLLERKSVERIKHEVYLDVYPSTKYTELLRGIRKMETDIQQLDAEIAYLKKYLAQLNGYRSQRARLVAGQQSDYDFALSDEYLSPVKGKISEINKKEQEFGYRSELIMNISMDQAVIKAFFEQADIEYIEPGDIVNIYFPDGSKSKGYIKNVYSNLKNLPAEFQKQYESLSRNIVADILPLDDKEAGKWKTNYKLGVKVRKWRYFD